MKSFRLSYLTVCQRSHFASPRSGFFDKLRTPLGGATRSGGISGAATGFQSTPLWEGRQHIFPDSLRGFRDICTNSDMLDEICISKVPTFVLRRPEMWCEGSGSFMIAFVSHTRFDDVVCWQTSLRRISLHDDRSLEWSATLFYLQHVTHTIIRCSFVPHIGKDNAFYHSSPESSVANTTSKGRKSSPCIRSAMARRIQYLRIHCHVGGCSSFSASAVTSATLNGWNPSRCMRSSMACTM